MKKIIQFLFYSCFLIAGGYASHRPFNDIGLRSIEENYNLDDMFVSASCDVENTSIICMKFYAYDNDNYPDVAVESTYIGLDKGREEFNISLTSSGSLIDYTKRVANLKPSYDNSFGKKIYGGGFFFESLLIEEDINDQKDKNIFSLEKSARNYLMGDEKFIIKSLEGENDHVIIGNGVNVDFSEDSFLTENNIVNLEEYTNTENIDEVKGNNSLVEYSYNSEEEVVEFPTYIDHIEDVLVPFEGENSRFIPTVIYIDGENMNAEEEDMNFDIINLSYSTMYPDIDFANDYGTDYYDFLD